MLELGGSDPFLVMPSADLDRAAEVAVTSRCQNNGQSCISAKRFIVHAAVADRFEELFAAKLAALVVGDPMDEKTDVGPLSTSDGRDDVEELVADAVGKGARVVVGGSRVDGPGWFYPPTLVTGITPEMRMYREEVFGPVAALYRVPDLDAGIALANDVDFGLGANIWTNDAAERERFVRDAEAGMVFVNGMVTSYPQLPFGGVKDSGYGRELTDVGMQRVHERQDGLDQLGKDRASSSSLVRRARPRPPRWPASARTAPAGRRPRPDPARRRARPACAGVPHSCRPSARSRLHRPGSHRGQRDRGGGEVADVLVALADDEEPVRDVHGPGRHRHRADHRRRRHRSGDPRRAIAAPAPISTDRAGHRLQPRPAEPDRAEPAGGAVQRPPVPDAVGDHRAAHRDSQDQPGQLAAAAHPRDLSR